MNLILRYFFWKHSNEFNYPLILSKVSRGGWMDTKIFVAGKIARSWVILTQYQSVDGLFAVKVLVDVWGPKLFADVTVIQTFKGGGGQQFGGKKATHQHSGAEREKRTFFFRWNWIPYMLMLGTFFALGSKSMKDLKPLEPTRDQTPTQILLHACSTIGLFSSQRTQCNTKCQNWPGLQKRFVQTILHFQITFLTASFIYCEHWTLS